MKAFYYSLVLVLFCLSCQSSQTVELACNVNKASVLIPPQNTYHLSLAVLENCGSGSIYLYEGRQQLNLEYKLQDLQENIVIYDFDWYENNLGIEFMPAVTTSDGIVKLKATFLYN